MLAFLGFVLDFIGIILLISSSIGIAKKHSFAKCSQSVMGRVGNKYVHHSNNCRHYCMDILYTVDGKEYKRAIPADLSEYDTLEKGDSFEVKYKPDNPKKIIRADSLSEKNEKALHTLLITSIVMTVTGVALILIQICIVNM